MMKPQKEVKISNWAAHTTTGVSVTLALLTLGLIALIWIAATSESRRMMEKIEISVVMADSISDDRADAVRKAIENTPFAQNVRLITRQQALENWREATGEDLEHVFGVNPLSPEVAFTVAAEYSSVKGIAGIKKSVSAISGVEEVGTPDSRLIEAMNDNIRRLTLGFTILAAVMLVISFVLISNTVRLSIYSKRFTIHTMQLVGATDGFIRRPFIVSNACVGALSGFVASALLSGALALSGSMGMPELAGLIGWTWMGAVDVSLIVGGALICALAALLSTTRHLRQDYGELFK
ncbi:MAG: permease-like cell division protein FtsX [Muribaculaceae bacterium]|nr:permease-like cell division protein FtsX [Muribaculaceae bacterium]MDE6552052.1 permease-like cell division protein FtsX [Muribaculaceae bacterium]